MIKSQYFGCFYCGEAVETRIDTGTFQYNIEGSVSLLWANAI